MPSRNRKAVWCGWSPGNENQSGQRNSLEVKGQEGLKVQTQYVLGMKKRSWRASKRGETRPVFLFKWNSLIRESFIKRAGMEAERPVRSILR